MRLLAASAAWVAGVAVAVQWDVSTTALGLLLVPTTVLGVLFRRMGWNLLFPLALASMLLGMGRVELAGPPLLGLQPWIGVNDLKVEGVVVEDPEVRGSALRFRFQVQRVNSGDGWLDTPGDILVTASPSEDLLGSRNTLYIRYGDRLVLQGTLDAAPAFEDFDYQEYLARQGIQALMSRPRVSLLLEGEGSAVLALVYKLRRSLSDSLGASLPEPQASLTQTLLLGIRSGLPAGVTQTFRNTGTSHLLAISGLHVGVVLGLSLSLAIPLLGRRRNLYLLLPLGLLWLYALLSAFSPSVERAAIIASLYLLAVALGRQRNALPALAFAAAVMVAVEPGVLYNLSFQLSFTAVTGILLLWRPLQSLMSGAAARVVAPDSWWDAITNWALAGMAVSLAAVVATFPLLAFNFHSIALLSVPATLLALPALPLVLVASLVTALAGLAAPALGHVAGWVAWLPLSYTLSIVELLSRLPGTVLHLGNVSGVLVWAYYGGAAALALALSFLGRKGRRRLAMLRPWRGDSRQTQGFGRLNWPVAKTGALLSVAAVALLVWTANAYLPDGKLHVDFLDVGQGDAVFIQTPEGHQVLVDGGPDPRRLLEALGKRMPFWDRTLDVVVLTHAQEDHLAGLPEVLRRYRVAIILDNPCPSDCPLYAAWRSLVETEGAQVLEAMEGQSIKLGDTVTLEVLNPPVPPLTGTSSDVNNNATVVRLRHGSVSFLLTGDLHWEGETSLIDRGGALEDTVLKVAHHGSASSSRQEFLDSVRPLLAVVSVGQNNRYRHPDSEVMDRLSAATGGPENVLTTKDHGDIGLVSDGQQLVVRTQC